MVTASMNAIFQNIVAGAQLKLLPATGALRFALGFRTSLGKMISQFMLIRLILHLSKREAKSRDPADDTNVLEDKIATGTIGEGLSLIYV